MLVKDIMAPHTHAIAKGATLREAGQLMARHSVGFLPVREGGQLVGVVTDRDVAVRSSALDRKYDLLEVGDVMTPRAHAVRSSLPIAGLALAMKRKGCQRLLVVDDSQNLVGTVTLRDLASRSADPTLAGDVLADLSERYAMTLEGANA